MAKLTAYVVLWRLIESVEAVGDSLMPNEREMLHSLKLKYASPVETDPFDVTALEVMLRNVKVRESYNFDSRRDSGRVIDLPRTKGGKIVSE